MSFSWKGIFGMNGQDPSGSQESRTNSFRRTAGLSRSATPASNTQGAAQSASPPHVLTTPQAIQTARNGDGQARLESSSPGSAGTQPKSPPMNAASQGSPSQFGRQVGSAPFPASLGWPMPEWQKWVTDNGRSVHESENKVALLGIENFGNTCYANSVLQILYFCPPLREAVMQVDAAGVSPVVRQNDTLHSSLVRLFHAIALGSARVAAEAAQGPPKPTNPSGAPTIYTQTVNQDAIKSFLETLMRNCDLFDSSMHHDAHEFLNYILNQTGEDLSAIRAKRGKAQSPRGAIGPAQDAFSASAADDTQKTYVYHLFQGILTNETRCLTCETISYRDEEFLDLSINVSPFTSVSSCLRQFSESEMLCGRNKFFCDSCSSLQEAEKRMKIRHSPNILALHLKRFKWDEKAQAYVKHACRVVFPFDLRLFNTSDQSDNPDRSYELFGIVIHVGAGAHQGHYISVVKIGNRWALFDDETVEFIAESDIAKYYGDSPEIGSAYVLFYRATDLDMKPRRARLEQRPPVPSAAPSTLSTAPQPSAPQPSAPQPQTQTVQQRVPVIAPVASPVASPVAAPVAAPALQPLSSSSESAGGSAYVAPRAIPLPVASHGAPAPIALAPPIISDGAQGVQPAPALFANVPSPTIPTKLDASAPMAVPAMQAMPPAPQVHAPSAHESPDVPSVSEAPAPAMPRSHTISDLFSPLKSSEQRRPREEAPTKRSFFGRSGLSRTLKLDRSEKS